MCEDQWAEVFENKSKLFCKSNMLKEANENKLEIFGKIRNVYINTNCFSNLMKKWLQFLYSTEYSTGVISNLFSNYNIILLTVLYSCTYHHILIADLT